MLEVSGYDVFDKSRDRPVVVARVMVSAVLLDDGLTVMQIGRLLGKNHTTIVHYKGLMNSFMTSPGYGAERDLWEKFKNTIQQCLESKD